MPFVDTNRLTKLQKNLSKVRNICILAHVDHGKTTLADSLVASNGIISQRMAGKLRYLDNRPDEQTRGITMKSSSISLYFQDDNESEKEDYLINLIDSPGHVDFSSEVSTAVRLCDGAIVVVDVIEGVCPQTRACLQQTYTEQLKPVLVLNKIDRLILEQQLNPLDAYYRISQVLEQVNAVLGSVFASDVFSKEDTTKKDTYESALEDVDDSALYFIPENGNVVFSSAIDGWAFSVSDFVNIYSERLGISHAELQKVLWGDFYYNSKTKCAHPGAQEKAKKPMFVQFVLENLWNLYQVIVVRKDKEKLPGMAEKLGIKLSARDLRLTDVKALIKTFLGQWLPIDRCVLRMVVQHVLPPNVMSDERAERLLFPPNVDLSTYSKDTLSLKKDFTACDAASNTVIAFVSKMCSFPISQLPQNMPQRLSEEDLQKRREIIRQRILHRKKQQEQGTVDIITEGIQELTTEPTQVVEAQEENEEVSEQIEDQFAFIAFARIFSGTLKTGQKLYALAPKHDPRQTEDNSPFITEVTVGNLYMFMGAELHLLDEVPAGNIVGIGGLESAVIKTATLCTSTKCPSFSEMTVTATPILRVALETVIPSDMPKLVKGLKLLNQADACVQVSVDPTGEHVITTLGEVHVEKCVRDLEENYAKVKINVSKPIVSFRETIVPEATMDMVNEAIVKTDNDISKKIITMKTANKLGTIKIIALPLPEPAVELLEKYSAVFKELANLNKTSTMSEKYNTILLHVTKSLSNALNEMDFKGISSHESNIIERIWSIGPRKCGTNILLNLTDYEHTPFWLDDSGSRINNDANYDIRRDFDSSFVNGFQLTTAAGPLCEEPMQGVCFVVLEWAVEASDDLNSKSYGPFSGQVMSTAKEACKQAFKIQPQRLVTPMYSCSIVVDAEALGICLVPNWFRIPNRKTKKSYEKLYAKGCVKYSEESNSINISNGIDGTTTLWNEDTAEIQGLHFDWSSMGVANDVKNTTLSRKNSIR